jgi:poly(ADP-ribose) glycohydrolase ARH3
LTLLERFRGAILGTAVGDALGRPFEGGLPTDSGEVEKAASVEPELRYTDDTQMTLGVITSLVECEGFNGEHMAKVFARNYEPFRNYGPSTSWILQQIKRGETWDLPAREAMGGQGSYGNGSAMRVAPVGLLYHQDLSKVREVAVASSRITHTHPLGTEGAAIQALAVAMAVQTEKNDLSAGNFLKKLTRLTEEDMYLRRLEKIGGLLGRCAPPSVIAKELGNGVEAFNSVPAAIYSFLAFPGSFKGAVLGAVGLGGDADTLGAMTGALAGACYGVGEIPSDWLGKLEGRSELEKLANGLFLLFVKEVLRKHCEICSVTDEVKPYKLDPEGGDDLSNFILLCPKCKMESEGERGEPLAKPKKSGKYRAVYRKVYRKK